MVACCKNKRKGNQSKNAYGVKDKKNNYPANEKL